MRGRNRGRANCGKVAFLSRCEAKKALREMARRKRDKGLDVYECSKGCPKGTWHIGHSHRKARWAEWRKARVS